MVTLRHCSIAAFVALSSLTSSLAAPVVSNAAFNSSSLVTAYNIPLNNGTDSLPSPNTTLKVITIGRGTQNYTCASSNSSAPKSTGAVATIFNLQDLLPIIPPLEGQAVLNILSPLLLSMPRAALDGSIIPKAGYHYFDASGSPVFDLSSSGNGVIVGSKVADITAPDATAAQGPNGAVDWLTLDAKDGSQGLSRVYRTQTASGKPPATCDGKEGEFAVEYAALYYFLG